MSFRSFLKLVEIQTKIASQLPLLNGTLIAIWLYGQVDGINLILMLTSLLCIDMATTAINNYMDFKKAHHAEGYGYEGHNAIVKDGLDLRWVRAIILFLFATATILGCLLAWRTDLWVLLMGMAAYTIGIAYTFGPIPISRTPFGEIVSGVAMGFGILFLAVYIHQPAPEWFHLGVSDDGKLLTFSMAWWDIFRLIFLSVPLVIGIGNIMFANNICDMDEDFKNHRFTLPLSIGRAWSLRLYGLAYLGGYGFLVLGMIFGILPWTGWITLGTAIPVFKLTREFTKNPNKETTFKKSVVSFLWIAVGYAMTWLCAILLIQR